jgi:Ca-activated chloride channel family protein
MGRMNLEDPRISAWLMPDAAGLSVEDRAAVEAALAADPQLAAAVEQLRALTARLEAHYQASADVDEADLQLDEGRRAAIAAADATAADAPADAPAAAAAAPARWDRSKDPRPTATLADLGRWDRQPLFIRLAAMAAAFWLLGLPMLRWGMDALIYRTDIGRGIYCWRLQELARTGNRDTVVLDDLCDDSAKATGDHTEAMSPPSLLDLVLRREPRAEHRDTGSAVTDPGTGSEGEASDFANYSAAEVPMDPGSSGAAQAHRRSGGVDGSPADLAPDCTSCYAAPEEPREDLPESSAGEGYQAITDNPFRPSDQEPLSTFSIDVDTASYANVRRYLSQMGQLPPADAVRIEELLNSFSYADEPPPVDGRDPFGVHLELGPAPWAPRHRLLRIGLKGKEIPPAERPDVNLVFLVDVSGSMQDANKLPLVKEALGLLVEELGARDTVSIVVYAGSSGLVLPPTRGDDRRTLLDAIERLEAGGSTNGGEGIQLAYRLARERFVRGAANRVILMTDGDFNVGQTDHGSLEQLITEEARSGVFLTVLGFGMGNLQDDTLELLADKGNGSYGYIDNRAEARRLLVEQLSGTLVTIAKDVKIQVEFNPRAVAYWRQIGYENRALAARDFNDDRKDAGEIGAGHSVTALYELVPVGEPLDAPGIDPLRYGASAPDPGRGTFDSRSSGRPADELLYLKLRYKEPDGETSRLLETPVRDEGRRLEATSPDFRFAAAVAAFGMLLRQSPYRGASDWAMVERLGEQGLGRDPGGYRQGFLDLVAAARRLGD